MRVQKLGQMRISKFSAYILWIISILWFGLCLFLSWQVGEDTVRLSEGMAQNIRRVIQLFGYEVEITSLHMFLRKSAHMAVFFVAGVLCTFSLR